MTSAMASDQPPKMQSVTMINWAFSFMRSSPTFALHTEWRVLFVRQGNQAKGMVPAVTSDQPQKTTAGSKNSTWSRFPGTVARPGTGCRMQQGPHATVSVSFSVLAPCGPYATLSLRVNRHTRGSIWKSRLVYGNGRGVCRARDARVCRARDTAARPGTGCRMQQGPALSGFVRPSSTLSIHTTWRLVFERQGEPCHRYGTCSTCSWWWGTSCQCPDRVIGAWC